MFTYLSSEEHSLIARLMFMVLDCALVALLASMIRKHLDNFVPKGDINFLMYPLIFGCYFAFGYLYPEELFGQGALTTGAYILMALCAISASTEGKKEW